MAFLENKGGREEERRKERIGIISKLEIAKISKAELILIILGLKPATEIKLKKTDTPQEFFEKSLSEAGIAWKKMPSEKRQQDRTVYEVAGKLQDAEALQRLRMRKDRMNEEYHREFGRLMGFPQTAIDAFFCEEALLPTEPSEDSEVVMGAFRYSMEHWEKEHEVQRQWSRALEKYAPDLHKELKDQKRN